VQQEDGELGEVIIDATHVLTCDRVMEDELGPPLTKRGGGFVFKIAALGNGDDLKFHSERHYRLRVVNAPGSSPVRPPARRCRFTSPTAQSRSDDA
jgi:hypothetical protein